VHDRVIFDAIELYRGTEFFAPKQVDFPTKLNTRLKGRLACMNLEEEIRHCNHEMAAPTRCAAFRRMPPRQELFPICSARLDYVEY